VVEVAEIVVHKADEPNAVAHLLDSDALAGEDGAEIDLLPIEADAAAMSVVKRIGVGYSKDSTRR
jgi:hypothetical protein